MATLVQHHPSPTIERANYHHFIMDVAWYGFAIVAVPRFIQYYAIKLGATPIELGWLTALPSLVLIFATAFSQWWRNRYANTTTAVFIPAVAMRLMFLLPAFAPFMPEQWRTLWIIMAASLPAIPQGIASTIFMVMMRETIHPDNISPLITRRLMVMNITLTLGSLGFGFLLELLPFPYNYQIMFVLAFAFAMFSCWHVAHVHELDMTPKPTQPQAPQRKRSWRELLGDVRFVSTAWVALITHLAQTFVATPQALHLKNNLGATESFLGLFGVAELVSAALVTLWAGYWVKHWGNRAVIVIFMMLGGLAAAIIAFSPYLWMTLIGSALAGASWTAAYIGILGFFTERTEANDYQATTVWHQLLFIGAFVGPMLGSSLVQAGYTPVTVLLIGAALRVGVGALSHFGVNIFGLRRVKPIR